MTNFTAGAFSDFNLATPLPGSGWGVNTTDRFNPINASYEINTYGGIFIDLFDHIDTNTEKDITFQVKTNEFRMQSFYFTNLEFAYGIQICSKTDKLISDNVQPKSLIIEIEASTDEHSTTIILEINYKVNKPEFKILNKRFTFDNPANISREFLFQSFISDLPNTDNTFEVKITNISGAPLDVGTTLDDFHTVGDKWVFLPIDFTLAKHDEITIMYEVIIDGLMYSSSLIFNKRIPTMKSSITFTEPIYIKIGLGGTEFIDLYSYLDGENKRKQVFDFITTWSKNQLFNQLFTITKMDTSLFIKNKIPETMTYLNTLNTAGVTIPDNIPFNNIIRLTDSITNEMHTNEIVIDLFPNFTKPYPTELNFYYNDIFNCDIDLSNYYDATKYHASIVLNDFDPAYDLQLEHNVSTGLLRLFTNTPTFIHTGNHSVTINFTELLSPDKTESIKINLIQRVDTFIDPMRLNDYIFEIGRFTPKAINLYELVNGLTDYSDINFELVDGGESQKYYPNQILDIGSNGLNHNLHATVRFNESIFREFNFILKCKDKKTYTDDSNIDSVGNIVGYRESNIKVKVQPNDVETKTAFILKNFNYYLNKENNPTGIIKQYFEESLYYLVSKIDGHKNYMTPLFTIDPIETKMPVGYNLTTNGLLLTGLVDFDLNLINSENYKLVLLFRHPEDPTNEEYKVIINFKYK